MTLSARSDGRLDPAEFDLLSSPLLRAEMPGVELAFDGASMRRHLQAALLDGGRYTIEGCLPGHATYIAGSCSLMRYEIELRDNDSGEVIPKLVNARVWRSRSDAAAYFTERLAPVAEKMSSRVESVPLAHSAAVIEPLNMTVSVWPVDGELPTLIGATDPPAILELLSRALPAARAGDFVPRSCSVSLGHYGRQHRCLLKYELEGADERSLLIYGKVAADGRGALTEPVIAAIRDEVLAHTPDAFAIPRSFGFFSHLQLVLLESIPGVPQVAQLLKARLRGEGGEPAAPSLEEAIDSCARVAALLHSSGISEGRPRRLDDELAMLHAAEVAIGTASPGFALRFGRWINGVERHASSSRPSPPCFSHGDFSYTQLIFAGRDCGLVDFDTMCRAEPALDLGQFLAYLRVAMMKSQKTATPEDSTMVEGLCARFLGTYVEESAPEHAAAALERVPIYELISLLRLAFHSWQKFKPSRLSAVAPVIEERLRHHSIGTVEDGGSRGR
ncbi:MAG: phosphotransferase [Actinomycetota bacterium]